jgi:hypothetical protein
VRHTGWELRENRKGLQLHPAAVGHQPFYTI